MSGEDALSYLLRRLRVGTESDPSKLTRVLGYFHNSGYHVLRDADFVGLFRLDAAPDPTYMPFFAEFVRTRRVVRFEQHALVAKSVALLKKHLARRPDDNPITRFSKQFAVDVERLKGEGLAAYHIYAFATIRQLGEQFELEPLYLPWLGHHDHRDPAPTSYRYSV